MDGLGGLVRSSLDGLGLNQKILEHRAITMWQDVVGTHIAASSIAEKVRDGVLFVCCKSSTWSNELSFHKEDIIKRLNRALGKKVITDIRFTARGFRRAAVELKDEKRVGPKAVDEITVEESDVQAADKAAAGVPSQELAEKIRKAILTGKRLAELKRRDGQTE